MFRCCPGVGPGSLAFGDKMCSFVGSVEVGTLHVSPSNNPKTDKVEHQRTIIRTCYQDLGLTEWSWACLPLFSLGRVAFRVILYGPYLAVHAREAPLSSHWLCDYQVFLPQTGLVLFDIRPVMWGHTKRILHFCFLHKAKFPYPTPSRPSTRAVSSRNVHQHYTTHVS